MTERWHQCFSNRLEVEEQAHHCWSQKQLAMADLLQVWQEGTCLILLIINVHITGRKRYVSVAVLDVTPPLNVAKRNRTVKLSQENHPT